MTSDEALRTSGLSTAELMDRAAAQLSSLVHDEISLAKTEMAAKARTMGGAGALLGTALLMVRCGLVLAWVLLVVGLATVWPLWLAVAVPMGGALVLAAVLAELGKRRLAQAAPPAPTQTVASVTADLRTVRDAAQEGRRS